jgi:hypothetical protein
LVTVSAWLVSACRSSGIKLNLRMVFIGSQG